MKSLLFFLAFLSLSSQTKLVTVDKFEVKETSLIEGEKVHFFWQVQNAGSIMFQYKLGDEVLYELMPANGNDSDDFVTTKAGKGELLLKTMVDNEWIVNKTIQIEVLAKPNQITSGIEGRFSNKVYNCSEISTKEYSKNGVNLVDPIKEDINYLRAMAQLGSTDFNGHVAPENNFALQRYNQKLEFLKKLNEERAKGNIVVEKRSPLIIINTSPDIGIMLIKSGNEFILTTWPDEKFCVNDYNLVYIQLNDGSILTFGNYYENCDGVIYLSITEKELLNMKNGIITISVDTKDKIGENLFYLNKNQNEQISTYINCLLNN